MTAAAKALPVVAAVIAAAEAPAVENVREAETEPGVLPVIMDSHLNVTTQPGQLDLTATEMAFRSNVRAALVSPDAGEKAGPVRPAKATVATTGAAASAHESVVGLLQDAVLQMTASERKKDDGTYSGSFELLKYTRPKAFALAALKHGDVVSVNK